MPSFVDLDGLRTFKEHLNLSGTGNAILPQVIVSSETGNTVTMSKDDVTLTATESSGTWIFTIPYFADWTITSSDGQRSDSKTISIDTVKIYNTSVYSAKRYGYRISKTEADPDARVEYLYDAEGFTPAHMDFENGVFDYGSWADVWFVKDNKPCMLKTNGTVAYYLDPNDYSKKEDGTPSNVANTSTTLNAMAQFPLVWVYRYEDDDYLYEIVSNEQWDENYKAYAHTDADDIIKPYFYTAMFGASGNTSKLRSLSGQNTLRNVSLNQSVPAATANGSGWHVGSWSQHQLIRTLTVLIGKSCDTPAVFGYGNQRSSQNESDILPTGGLNDKGQFFGYSDSTHHVKIFHIEDFWGNIHKWIVGICANNGTYYAKMTPVGNYNLTSTTGYTNTNVTFVANGTQTGYISQMSCSEYGLLPIERNGSSSTYFCDFAWHNASGFHTCLVGSTVEGSKYMGGAFIMGTQSTPNDTYWAIGCVLSYV